MDENICKICGSVKNPTDGNGNPGPFCPNECEYYSTEIFLEPIGLDGIEELDEPRDVRKFKNTHCWNCGTEIDKSKCTQDSPYGYYCPQCGHSLRDHQYFGVGGSGDLGNKSLAAKGQNNEVHLPEEPTVAIGNCQISKSRFEEIGQKILDNMKAVKAPVNFAKTLARSPGFQSKNHDKHNKWLIGWNPDFDKSIRNFDKKIKGRILEAVGDLSEHPEQYIKNIKEPLHANLKGLWKYKIRNDFRLIYKPDSNRKTVVLLKCESRGGVYKS